MSVWAVVLLVAVALIGWLAAYMLSQKRETTVQELIQSHRYLEAVAEADRHPADSATHLHRAEALKLLGRFEDAIASYRRSNDPAANEGIALSLTHLGQNFPEARRLMQEQIAQFPQIQEFQQLSLAYIDLRAGDRESALRTFRDNVELLETRFRDDYTDPDPLLAETLVMFAALCDANGDPNAAALLRARAAEWAPGSVWARDIAT